MIAYLDEHKYPKRRQFVKAWTSHHRHFGHITTSKGESGHAAFKRYLEGNHHDLLDLKDKWSVMLKVWRNNFAAKLAIARDRPANELKATRWSFLDPQLNKQIVPDAMKLLVRQLYFIDDRLQRNTACSTYFEKIYGILCYHSLPQFKDRNVKVTKQDFDKHWHFDRPIQDPTDGEAMDLPPEPPAPEGPAIFAPHTVVTRGRRRKDRTTRRDPSGWERAAAVESSQQRRPGVVGGESSRVSASRWPGNPSAC